MGAEGPDVHRGALEAWLAARLGAARVRVGELVSPSGGYSAETLIFSARVETDRGEREERFVLRKEVPGPPVYPQQVPGRDVEVELQYSVMEGLARTSDVPVAPLHGYEPDPEVLGAPFFVMGFVDGEVPRENPIYTKEGFFVDVGSDERRRIVEDGIRVMARIHGVDHRAAGLEWLVPEGTIPGVAAQVDLWQRYAEAELRGREHPVLDEAFRWVWANLPDDRENGLNWGDPRLGNMIWRHGRCVCVTDFEGAAIGPPELDLGWWLMFDRWSHETMGVERLPGELSREEQRDLYERCLGRDVGDVRPFEVFAAARYAAIVVRVMNRSVDRGELPSDQTIWLENPAAACLENLLREV